MNKLAFFIVLALLFVSTGCSQEEMELEVRTIVNFDLENKSLFDTHMWITGETIGPTNKLAAPTIERRVVYTKSDDLLNDYEVTEEIVTVYAGRNGQVIATKTYRVTRETVAYTVTFNNGSIN